MAIVSTSRSIEGGEGLGFEPRHAGVVCIVDRQHTFRVRCHEKPNPLCQATVGLKACYERVKQRTGRLSPPGGWGETPQNTIYTSADGSLRLGPHLPLFMSRFRYCGLIGQGTFSQIVKAEDTYLGGRHVAIKVLNFHYSEIGKRETLCLRLLHSSPEGRYSSIVRLHTAFDFLGHFCLVLELCQGGSLQNFIAPSHDVIPASTLSLDQVREVALQLVKALLFIHSRDVIHADIKPENVLLSSALQSTPGSPGGSVPAMSLGPLVRLTDLGNAIKKREVRLYKEDYEIQTLSYRAPEVLVGGCGGKAFDEKIDMWSLGAVLVELYTGKPLFRARSKVLAIKQIMAVLGPLPARSYVTGKFYSVLFNNEHKMYSNLLALDSDPKQNAAPLNDVSQLRNSFRYDEDAHHRMVYQLLQSRDHHFVSFICGLLKLDPGSRMSSLDALMHPFLSPCFPFSMLRPFMLSSPHGEEPEARSPQHLRISPVLSHVPPEKERLDVHTRGITTTLQPTVQTTTSSDDADTRMRACSVASTSSTVSPPSHVEAKYDSPSGQGRSRCARYPGGVGAADLLLERAGEGDEGNGGQERGASRAGSGDVHGVAYRHGHHGDRKRQREGRTPFARVEQMHGGAVVGRSPVGECRACKHRTPCDDEVVTPELRGVSCGGRERVRGDAAEGRFELHELLHEVCTDTTTTSSSITSNSSHGTEALRAVSLIDDAQPFEHTHTNGSEHFDEDGSSDNEDVLHL